MNALVHSPSAPRELGVRAFVWAVVLLPVLEVYRGPIPGERLSSFTLLALTPLLLLGMLRSPIFFRPELGPLFAYFGYAIALTGATILLHDGGGVRLDGMLMFFRLSKLVIFPTLVLAVFRERYFDFDYALKVLRIFTLFASGVMLLQSAAFYLTGRVISGVALEFVFADEYASLDYQGMAAWFYRPSSIFYEPSHFVQYVVLGLAHSVFGFRGRGHSLVASLVITAAMIASTSIQGLLSLAIIWGAYFAGKMSGGRQRLLYMAMFIGVVAYVIPALLETSLMTKTVGRVTDPNAQGGSALEARTASIAHYWEMSPGYQVFGKGYGNPIPGIYFNGAVYTLYCTGLVGALLVLNFFRSLYFRASSFQRVGTVVYLVAVFGAHVLSAVDLCFYLSFLLTARRVRPN